MVQSVQVHIFLDKYHDTCTFYNFIILYYYYITIFFFKLYFLFFLHTSNPVIIPREKKYMLR